jgi:8-oxo-dGTP diphosphatase
VFALMKSEPISSSKELTAMMLITTIASPKKVLLLLSRKHQLWMPPGGHVEPNENPFEAVLREVLEETGIDASSYFPKVTRYDKDRVEVPLPARIVEVHLTHGGVEHYHVDCMYLAKVSTELPVKHDDTESSSIGWFSLPDLSELHIPADILPAIAQELKV